MLRIVTLALVFFWIIGCSDTKPLPGGYSLERWEDGETYYVIGPGDRNEGGGGAIDGTARRLTWNSELIAVDRHATSGTDKNGWIIIDVKTKEISGPVTEEAFRELQNKHRLRIMMADEAWKKL